MIAVIFLMCGKAKGSMNRFIITKNVNTKTVITDRKNGKNLFDTENSYVKEFSLLKVVVSALILMLSGLLLVVNLKLGSDRKKALKMQKMELRELKKLCKKADIEF